MILIKRMWRFSFRTMVPLLWAVTLLLGLVTSKTRRFCLHNIYSLLIRCVETPLMKCKECFRSLVQGLTHWPIIFRRDGDMKIILAFVIVGIIGFYLGYLWIVSLCAFGCVFAVIHSNDKRRARLQEGKDDGDIE